MRTKPKFALPLTLILPICLSLSAATFAQTDGEPDGAKVSSQPLPLEELRAFTEVFGKIKSEYVDQVDDTTLLRDAIEGMLAGLDPHSALLDPEAFKEMRISTEGKFGGIGIEITAEDGFIKVVAPIDHTPAQRAGIRSGDTIVMLDGTPLRNLPVGEAVERMRGAPGTQIVLTISREGEPAPFDIPLTRAIIQVASVTGEMLEDGFGYIRITNFQSDTGGNLRAQIEQLQQENAGALHGLILDLRNNPGGVLHGAVEVSDVFLPDGLVVSTRGRNAANNHGFSATTEDATGDMPLVVLVNGGSASSAEIVAGALQDHKRAIILGSRTFGKGSVQTVIPTNNGGALKLTTARYYTPSGRSIQARGIAPDIVVEANPPNSHAVEWDRRELREADLDGHLENDAAGEGETPTADSGLATRDHQVGAALDLLKGMSLMKLRAGAKPANGEG